MKTEEMDVFDLLVVEVEAFEELENPDRDVDEGQFVAERNVPDPLKINEEELAEELRSGLVATEPSTRPEKPEAVPALQIQDQHRPHIKL